MIPPLADLLHGLLPEGVWIALIGGAVAIASIILKEGHDGNARRIDEAQADIHTMKEVMGDVVTWAFALETHVSEGRPPPPPDRPPALIEFFTTTFVERARTSQTLPKRRRFPIFRKKENA